MRRPPHSSILPLGRLVTCLLLLCAVAPMAKAQTDVTARGMVLDDEREALSGAVVTLSIDGRTESATTGDDGRWAIPKLPSGAWRIVVKARGYLDAEGSVMLRSGQPVDIRIELRPEEIETRSALEGHFDEVQSQIGEGNRLLAVENYPEARESFEKALPWMPDAMQAETQSSIARTWYMEGNKDAAVESLEKAVRLAPGDTRLRRLIELILGELNRKEEAEAFFATLDDAQAAEAARARPEIPERVRLLIAREPEAAAKDRTGQLKIRLDEGSPLSSLDLYLERTGQSRKEVLRLDPNAERYDLSREAFQLFVPDNYERDAGFGLLVWLSPSDFGGVVGPEAQQLLGERKLIWIGPDRAGNSRWVWDRWRLAIDAATAMRRFYDLDPGRIYVGGYSGGGRVSSGLTLLYPEVFHGGVFFFGCDYYHPLPIPDRPGTHFSPAFPEPPRQILDIVHDRNRFVFITGQYDFNRVQTRLIHDQYEAEGFRNLSFFDIPGLSHFSTVPTPWLRCAFEALDSPVASCRTGEP